MSNAEDPNTPAAELKKVFVISPIGPADSEVRRNANRFLKYIVRVALPESEFEILRADEDNSSGAITEAMLTAILEADVLVADITGRNPNVMYELALAHAADKKVIIMKSDGGSLPFDIKDMRAIDYGMLPEQVEEAVDQLRAKVKHEPKSKELQVLINPVAYAFRQWTDLQRAESQAGTPEGALARYVENGFERLERKMEAALQVSEPSQFGRPTVTQNTQPAIDILDRAALMYQSFIDIMNDSPTGEISARSLQYRNHISRGEQLIYDAKMGRGDLARLDLWSNETEQLILAKRLMDDRQRGGISGSGSLT